MCCSDLSYLEALQNPRDAADSRHRRDMELRSMSRRMVAEFSINWCKRRLPIVPRRSPAGQQGELHAVVGAHFQERLKESETS